MTPIHDPYAMAGLMAAVAAGLVVGVIVCRSRWLHGHPWAQRLVTAVGIVALVAAAPALAPVDAVGADTSPGASLAALLIHAAAIAAVVPFLRQCFAFALLDFEPGERVRIDGVEGTVARFACTGLEIRTDEASVILLPTDVLSETVSRLPEPPSSTTEHDDVRRRDETDRLP